MIPPADGLNENQLALLSHLINEIERDGKGWLHYTYLKRNAFKDLCEFGVIGVATVTYNHWQSSPVTPFTKNGFVVWITEKGHEYMRGEIDVAKPCTIEDSYKYGYLQYVCKRHKKQHTKDEYEAFHRTKNA